MRNSKNAQRRDWYLDLVYSDPEFVRDSKTMSKNELQDKYFVAEDEIDFYLNGDFNRGRFINRRNSLEFFTDENKKEVTVKIGPDATLSDFKDAWPIVRALKWSMYGQEERRYRAPENPPLVYKVFRLRSENVKRGEIFSLYKTGNLLDIAYNTEQFSTPKELIEYCRPYFPTQIKPN